MNEPFDEVVTRHSEMVFRICRSVAGATAADDAWAETFLAAMRAWPSLPEDANVAAWLATIARNAAIDQIRTRHRTRPTDPAELERHLDGSDSIETVLPDDDLAAALAALSERQRDAVLYHHVAGLPHAETAVLIGGNAASVRRAAADGIAVLRRLLEPEER